MKFLTVSLTVLSLSASNLASQGRVMKPGNDDGYPDAITKDNRDNWNHKRDMEMWRDNGNGGWRRDRDYDDDFENRHHPRRGRWEDRRDRGSRRGDGGRRWNDGNGRDDGRLGNGNDKNFAPHPPTNPNPPPNGQPSYPDNQRPNDRDNFGPVMPPAPVITTMFPPLPIIIEPIRSRPVALPSIIEPYPEVIETSYSVNYPTPTSAYVPTSSAYIPTSSVYGPSSSVRPSSYAPINSFNKKAAGPVYHSNSTTVYASTVIMTEPEETVTTKVTGRYRAMSNAAAGNNLAGSISFTIILLSSVFLIALV